MSWMLIAACNLTLSGVVPDSGLQVIRHIANIPGDAANLNRRSIAVVIPILSRHCEDGADGVARLNADLLTLARLGNKGAHADKGLGAPTQLEMEAVARIVGQTGSLLLHPLKIPKSQPSLACSFFLEAYRRSGIPSKQHKFLGHVDDLIMLYSQKHGIAPGRAQSFFRTLEKEAFAEQSELLDMLPLAAQRMWSSAKTIPQTSTAFCSILNFAVFHENIPGIADPQLAEPAAHICRALAAGLADRTATSTFIFGAIPYAFPGFASPYTCTRRVCCCLLGGHGAVS